MIVHRRRSGRVRHTRDQAAAAALVVLGLAAYAGHAASAKHAASSHAHTVTAAKAGPQMSAADANVALGRRMAAAYGWTGAQWSCLDALWTRESSWQTTVWNYQGSGAYGIAQALPAGKYASAGSDWRTNPATQIRWGLSYIHGRYGTPCGAWAHETSAGWY